MLQPTHNRPKVLMVVTHCDMGGAELIALKLIETLCGQFEFELFAVLEDNLESPIHQMILERCAKASCQVKFGTRASFKRGGALQAGWRLARAIVRFKPDIVHLHCEIAELTYALATVGTPASRRKRVLRTIHNSVLWIAWARVGRLVTWLLRETDAVAVSRGAAAADYAILQSPNRQIADVIYNGVAVPAIRGKLQNSCSDEPFQLLFAGRFVDQKGYDLLPAIFSKAAMEVPSKRVHVTIAGHGEGAQTLAAATVPSRWQMIIIPPIADLQARLSEFDGVIMPSRFEGLALLAIESLMAGVPLVATNATGLDEVVPAAWPLVANVDDTEGLALQLAQLLADPFHFKLLALDLHDELVEQFSADVMAAAYADRYRQIAASA